MLHPYPSWNANELPIETDLDRFSKDAAETHNSIEMKTSKIISAAGIYVDECDRLWVLDSGKSESFMKAKYWSPPTIAIFNLNTNKLIRRFQIPSDQMKAHSFLANIVS